MKLNRPEVVACHSKGMAMEWQYRRGQRVWNGEIGAGNRGTILMKDVAKTSRFPQSN